MAGCASALLPCYTATQVGRKLPLVAVQLFLCYNLQYAHTYIYIYIYIYSLHVQLCFGRNFFLSGTSASKTVLMLADWPAACLPGVSLGRNRASTWPPAFMIASCNISNRGSQIPEPFHCLGSLQNYNVLRKFAGAGPICGKSGRPESPGQGSLPGRRAVLFQERALFALRLWISGGFTLWSRIPFVKGWNYHAHREFRGNLESTNPG